MKELSFINKIAGKKIEEVEVQDLKYAHKESVTLTLEGGTLLVIRADTLDIKITGNTINIEGWNY